MELLTQQELKSNYSLDAVCGILSQKGAANNAYLLTHEILQYCQRRGTEVFDRTSIKDIRRKNGKTVLKTADGYYITANFVINACGYEVVNFIEEKIVDLDCTYATISESMEGINDVAKMDTMMWNTDDPYLYLCTTKDSRIIIGGRDESFVNMKTMHDCVENKSASLEKDFKRCFPSIPLKKEFAWSGVFGKTKDSLPYIGSYPQTPGIFYALGFGGNGITFSVIAAEIITDLLLGKKNKDAAIFSFAR